MNPTPLGETLFVSHGEPAVVLTGVVVTTPVLNWSIAALTETGGGRRGESRPFGWSTSLLVGGFVLHSLALNGHSFGCAAAAETGVRGSIVRGSGKGSL